jgi:hypothetical protein
MRETEQTKTGFTIAFEKHTGAGAALANRWSVFARDGHMIAPV